MDMLVCVKMFIQNVDVIHNSFDLLGIYHFNNYISIISHPRYLILVNCKAVNALCIDS